MVPVKQLFIPRNRDASIFLPLRPAEGSWQRFGDFLTGVKGESIFAWQRMLKDFRVTASRGVMWPVHDPAAPKRKRPTPN